MIGNPKNITKLSMISGRSVSFGGKNKGKVIGQGTVKIGNLIINDVSLVKGLKYNLISVSQLCDSGYKICFQYMKCTGVSSDNKQSFSGYRHGNIYLLDVASEEIKCLISVKNESDLWHRKLGHISIKHISKLSSKNLVRGLPQTKFEKPELCTACTLGKQVRSTFKPINHVSTNRVLQLLHMDLFGLNKVLSLGGKKYCMVIVDDFSRFTWVIFLAYKSDAFAAFAKFSKRIQNEKCFMISCIKTDHGGEFEN